MKTELSARARAMEMQWEAPGDNRAKQRIREVADLSPVMQQMPSASYSLWAVRDHPNAGPEIFGPERLVVGRYDEGDLYGSAGSSSVVAFKGVLAGLREQARRIAQLDQDTADYGHQAALFWSEVGSLKSFIGASSAITEIVAELRTARFQFLGKDTPLPIFAALAAGLSRFMDSARWDGAAVDRFVEQLEMAGYDSLVIDNLRVTNA